MQKNTQPITIQNTDILNQFLDENGDPRTNACADVKAQFNDFFRRLRVMYESNGICPGEALCMINATYGFSSWRSMPWGIRDEVFEWMRNNMKNKSEIINSKTERDMQYTKRTENETKERNDY